MRSPVHPLFGRLFVAVPFIAALCATPASAAPYVWLTSDGTAAHAHIGNLLADKNAANAATATPPTLATPHATFGDKKDLAVQPAADGYTIALPAQPATDLRFTATSVAADGSLTYYEARAGRTDTKPVNDLELVPTDANGSTFRLFWQGKPIVASEVDVETSSGWRRTLHPQADGTVSLTSAQYPALFPSRYVLEVSAKLNGKVTLGDKTYDQVVHTATLTFDVPGK
jgi:hypothetical protein